jgi:D-alanine-D-alanine ligase
LKVRALKAKKIGVLMGGESSERDVSLRSGTAIYNALKSLNYNVVSIDAGKDLCSVLSREMIDIAFIALHGGLGENGAVQGMLEIMDIPYTGSGILASALAMDKEASKKVFLHHGIPVPPFVIVTSEKSAENSRSIRLVGPARGRAIHVSRLTSHDSPADFPLPWVIKPASEGSSVGVEIVKDKSRVKGALDTALSYGTKVIVEKYIEGKEVQIGILNNAILGGVEVKPSLEFYNYEAKYTAGLTEYIFPPRLDSGTYEKTAEAALSAHKALGCGGATRVDLIVDSSQRPFVLEVNTIPGMTETSLLPKIAKSAGLDFPVLLEEMLGGIADED